jgi:hypothetical protein
MPPRGKFFHVKGHITPTDQQSSPERLNILVDVIENEAITEEATYTVPQCKYRIIANKKLIYRAEGIVAHCQQIISQEY